MKDTKLRNATAVLSKIIEIVSWIGVVMLLVMSVVLTVNRNLVSDIYNAGSAGANITINGQAASTQTWIIEAVTKGNAPFVFAPYAVVLVFTALIFRNIYNVFKKTNTASPFSIENVRRIRNIGVFAIAIPICKIVIAFLLMLIVKSGDYNMSVSLSEVVFGLVALTLSQYFAYGVQLEKDVDGLV